MKGPINKKKDRSQRRDLRAKIISQTKYLTEFQRKKEECETKKKKAKSTAKKANQKPEQKKIINTNIKVVTSSSESEHEISSSIHTNSKSENDFNKSTNDSEKESTDGNSTEIKHILNHEMSEHNIENILWKTWDTIFPPVKEKNVKGKWYTIIYMSKKVLHTFIARLQKRFRADSDWSLEGIECVCLKEKLGFSDTVLEGEANPLSEIIVVSDVMIGSLKSGMAGRPKWNVRNNWKIKIYSEVASKFDRVSCKNLYICDKYKDC